MGSLSLDQKGEVTCDRTLGGKGVPGGGGGKQKCQLFFLTNVCKKSKDAKHVWLVLWFVALCVFTLFSFVFISRSTGFWMKACSTEEPRMREHVLNYLCLVVSSIAVFGFCLKPNLEIRRTFEAAKRQNPSHTHYTTRVPWRVL